MGILTKTRKTRLSIVKRFFAKQHYQWGKVQKFAGRLRVKNEAVPSSTIFENAESPQKKEDLKVKIFNP